MQFHIPCLKTFKELGWETAVAARNDYEQPADCNIPYCDKFYDIPFQRSPLKKDNLKSYKMLRKIIENGDYDIIHCHNPVSGVLGRIAARSARKAGCRVVYTAHGFHFFSGAPIQNWLLYYPIEFLSSYLTDDLITINLEDHDRACRRFHSKRTHYIHGVGIDLNRFSPNCITPDEISEYKSSLGIPQESKIILSVGELIPRKNYKTALQAFSLLNEPTAHYLICGGGRQRKELEMTAKSLGVQDRVHFLGYRRDIAKLCVLADLFLFTSSQEGLPVAIMEAMACGTAIVASKVRGNTDLITDGINGYLCDPNDVNTFVARMQELLSDPTKKEEFRKENMNRRNTYDCNVVLQDQFAVYNILLRKEAM